MSVATLQSKTLAHDINILLTLFNKADEDNTGIVSRQTIIQILNSLQLQIYIYEYLLISQTQIYQFDDLLSILGQVQVPEQPSVYILSFIKILALYRKRLLQQTDNDDINEYILEQARAIDTKINKIANREIERRKDRLLKDHLKIYEQMSISQEKQYLSFQLEWKNYLQEFQYQTYQKIRRAKHQKLKQLVFQSSKVQQKARRTSLLVSPKLRELGQKKKWLVKEGSYDQALTLNQRMNQEKRRLSLHYQKTINNSVTKKLQSMRKKNQTVLAHLQHESSINKNKLLAKKKEGENVMRIRMKNLRQEAQKKLNQHLRNEIGRLKSSLHIATKV